LGLVLVVVGDVVALMAGTVAVFAAGASMAVVGLVAFGSALVIK
jgi:hypothetical protein